MRRGVWTVDLSPRPNRHLSPQPGKYVLNMIGGGVLLLLIYFILVLL